MFELALVVGLVVVLFALSLTFVLPWELTMQLGAAFVVLGGLLGVPTGVVYHVLLHRALAPRGDLERGWIWNPFRFHARLRDEERGRVMAFAYAGGVGFAVLAVGLGLVVLPMLLVWMRGET